MLTTWASEGKGVESDEDDKQTQQSGEPSSIDYELLGQDLPLTPGIFVQMKLQFLSPPSSCVLSPFPSSVKSSLVRMLEGWAGRVGL